MVQLTHPPPTLTNLNSKEMQMNKATRKKVKIKMSIAAPTGFGKTYSALLLAYGITCDWNKICVIDTENESASLYAHLGDYNTIALKPPYMPQQYVEAIRLCEQSGIEVIIIDSVTHVWSGEGGLLEYQNKLGGRYQDWAKATPLYQQWLNAILQTPPHVICTARKKQAYNMVQDGNRTKVEKAGMEDEIRSGFDYEMTIAFELTNDKHMANAAKDRTGMFMNKPEFIINEETGKMIKAWCESGIDVPKPDPVDLPELTEEHPQYATVLQSLKDKKCDMPYVKSRFILSEQLENKLFEQLVF